MPGPSLGTNLSGIVDWSTAYQFVDHFKMGRPWFTQTADSWDTGQAGLLDLDAKGWVRGFTKDGSPAPFECVSTVLNTTDLPLRDGKWVLDWKGEGTIDVGFANVISRSANRIVLDPGDGLVTIKITATDPHNNGNYLRDLRFYHEQDKPLLDAGVVFNPDFISKIQDFRVLRFMDWMGTNNSDVSTWTDAKPAGAAFQSEQASLDMMIQLANETRADPWFNIPHLATSDYIRKFATYVRDHLDEGLVARFEYSNEVWNWGFEQAQWAHAQAQSKWGDPEGGWMQWYGMKATQMANIVAEVFGDETGTRALNVFSTQGAWQGLEGYALNAPAWVARGGMPPKEAPFHVYAIAPYFSGDIGSTEMEAQVNTWIAQGEAGFKAAIAHIANGPAMDSLANIGELISYHAGVAKSLGWQLEAYEGGQHVVDSASLFGGGPENPARTAFFTTLVNRPEFGELYERYLEIWKESGGGLMAQFSDIGTPGRYGSWGIWETVTGPDTSRAAAVEAFRDGVDVWWADERPASTFEGLSTLADRAGTGTLTGGSGRDRAFGLEGNDRISALGGDDALHGNAGNDSLLGGGGHDMLEGGAGADRLEGGSGNDTYLRDAGDALVELEGGGRDRVFSGATTALGAHFEELVLTGNSAISGNGNALANKLTGNTAPNTLHGNAGNDTLNGGAGIDRLVGGSGDDTYIVTAPGDVIVEAAGGGTDTVRASLSHTLSNHLENLYLTGASAVNGSGNGLANWIIGNVGVNTLSGGEGNDRLEGGGGSDALQGGSGNDLLNGGLGADRLHGGAGSDTFIIDSATDRVVETAGGGTADKISSSVSVTALAAHVEDLQLTGSGHLRGTGNELANRLAGNAGNNSLSGGEGNDRLAGDAGSDRLHGGNGQDRLDGGRGSDVLVGGASSDIFVFTGGHDAVADFRNDGDTILIDNALWGGRPKTIDQLLDMAKISSGDILFEFGSGNSLRIENLTNAAVLANDIAIV